MTYDTLIIAAIILKLITNKYIALIRDCFINSKQSWIGSYFVTSCANRCYLNANVKGISVGPILRRHPLPDLILDMHKETL